MPNPRLIGTVAVAIGVVAVAIANALGPRHGD
jgi:hypothetical protein